MSKAETAAAVVAALADKRLHIATAESCTGGLLAASLIDVPGASMVMEEGYITYSDRVKEKLLQVPHEVLAKYSAVSEQTAFYMAQGAAKAAETEVSIATTGLAGPGGATKEQPVGLVYIAYSFFGECNVVKCLFQGNRQEIREQAVDKAMDLLWQKLCEM